MTEAEYIDGVCRDNSLAEVADYLRGWSEECYDLDRHVAQPPEGLSARAACSAGLALLALWTDELPKVHALGLCSAGPLLVVDQSWLDENEDAPAPHVLLTLSKHEDVLPRFNASGHPVDAADSPINDLLCQSARVVKVLKVE